MKAKPIIVKAIILAIIVGIYSSIMQFISPVIANSLAMNQMQNSIDSSFGIQFYSYISNYGWIVLLAIILLAFKKEIKFIITKIKESTSNEE